MAVAPFPVANEVTVGVAGRTELATIPCAAFPANLAPKRATCLGLANAKVAVEAVAVVLT